MPEKIVRIVLVIIAAVFLCTGCSKTTLTQEPGSAPAAGATIRDSAGRVISMPAKLERVIVLNSSAYNMITAIGAGEVVIGVNDNTQQVEPTAADKAVFGTFRQPNVEKIIEARPDAVIGNTLMNPAQVKQLEDAGIAVFLFEFYIPSILQTEILTLGTLFHKEEQAQKYAGFILQYRQLIETRLKDIKPADKPTVYFEGYVDYSTVARGSGGDEMVNWAGGINIAGMEEVKYPKISSEWILQKNPQVIVKTISSNSQAMGEGYTDPTAVKALYDKMTARAGWQELAAVRNQKILFLAQDIGTTPEGSIIGMLYMAKAMYPDRFADIDTYVIYKQMKKEFYHVDTHGIMIYP